MFCNSIALPNVFSILCFVFSFVSHSAEDLLNPSVCMSLRPSNYQLINLFYPSIHSSTSLSTYQSTYLSVCLSVCLSIYLPIYKSVHPSIHPPNRLLCNNVLYLNSFWNITRKSISTSRQVGSPNYVYEPKINSCSIYYTVYYTVSNNIIDTLRSDEQFWRDNTHTREQINHAFTSCSRYRRR